MNAADRDLPPKQWTSTPPASTPASMNMFDAGIQDRMFASSLHSKVCKSVYVSNAPNCHFFARFLLDSDNSESSRKIIRRMIQCYQFYQRNLSRVLSCGIRQTHLSRTSTDKYVNCFGNDGGSREAFKICTLTMLLMAKFEIKRQLSE